MKKNKELEELYEELRKQSWAIYPTVYDPYAQGWNSALHEIIKEIKRRITNE